MRIVGDCIIEKGDWTVGVTLMVGITRTGAGLPAEAAAAAAPALRFLRPAAPAALILAPGTPPTTGPAMTRLTLKLSKPVGDAIGTAPVFVWAVAVVTTGLE